jgi:predicted membrane GTPase involved in stress response
LSLIDCRSHSNYVPDPENSNRTIYDFAVTTLAFPGKEKDAATGRFQLNGISRKIEEFVGGCLVGNVKQSELKINEFIARLRSDCMAGRSKVWLCGMLRKEAGLATASCPGIA